MPVGVLINSSVVVIGGILGALFSKRISRNVLEQLPIVFGLSAIAISIVLISKIENLTPVILALIVGTIIGEVLELENKLRAGIGKIVTATSGKDEHRTEMLITIFVLFCFSGTGIFGALNEGFTGDSTILIAKSVMDFFTATIFGASAGYLVSAIAIPQCCISMFLFKSATVVVPLLSVAMLSDFKACGGIITLAAAFRVAKIKNMNVINMLPALFLVMIFTYGWQALGL